MSQTDTQRRHGALSARLAEIVGAAKPDDVEAALMARAKKGTTGQRPELCRLIRAVMMASPAAGGAVCAVRDRVAEVVVTNLLCGGKLEASSERVAKECAQAVVTELEAAEPRCVLRMGMAIADCCVGLASTAGWAHHYGVPLSLLPKCVAVIEAAAERMAIETPKDGTVVAAGTVGADEDEPDAKKQKKSEKADAGSAKKKHAKQLSMLRENKAAIISKFCEETWPKQGIPLIIRTIAEIKLDRELHGKITAKALDVLSKVAPQDIFEVANALLELAKGGDRGTILRALVRYFDEYEIESEQASSGDVCDDAGQELISSKALHDMEGSVLYNVSIEASRDEGFAKDFVKALRAETLSPYSNPLTRISVAMLMAISRSPRLEPYVFDALRGLVVETHREAQRRISDWARLTVFGNHSDQGDDKAAAPIQPRATDVADTFDDVARISASYWDVVSAPLIKFAFHVVDHVGIRSSGGCCGLSSELAKLCRIGESTLCALFEHHAQPVQSAIIDTICGKIVSQVSAAPLYIGVLHRIIAANQRGAVSYASKLRAVIECLPRLPPQAVATFLAAVQSLLSTDRSLLDVAVISMRKALFGKDMKARESAVSGLVMLIHSAMGTQPSTVAPALAAASQSQARPTSRATDAERSILLHEIFGILGRALSQQREVKARLYSELADLAAAAPALCEQIALLLLVPHLTRLCNEDDATGQPLRIDACLDGSLVVEPLPELICSLARLGIHAKQVAAGVATTINETLGKLSKKFINSSLDDLGIVVSDPDAIITPDRRARAKLL
jgi:Fanconi anemia group I protein